ncbi:MAG: hypothetical protein J6038_03635, partial [Bacilli bacterium]|nr:hypothetical protein [Bacilli bacterium]
DVTEMIQFDGQPISQEDFVRLFNQNEARFKKFDLSAFEMQTYIAFLYFQEKKPDLCIIECGMGGETDATNIFEPILSIITSISLEHTAYLGRTLSEIAQEKAGILRPNTPLLSGILEASTERVLAEIAADLGCHYRVASAYHFPVYDNEGLSFSYEGREKLRIHTSALYQMKNACLAITAVGMLQSSFPVSEEALRQGLLEEPILHMEQHGNVFLDGAHNPEAIAALAETLSTIYANQKIHVLFACFRDKNISIELPLIGTYAADITLTTFPHKRARTEDDYFLYMEDHPFREDYRAALKELQTAYSGEMILVTGSLAFAALVRKELLEAEK